MAHFGFDTVSCLRHCPLFPEQGRNLKLIGSHSASSEWSCLTQNVVGRSPWICPECALNSKSSRGSSNLLPLSDEKRESHRGIRSSLSFPKVTGARLHVLAFHQAPNSLSKLPKAPLISCEFKPLPLLTCGHSLVRALKWRFLSVHTH